MMKKSDRLMVSASFPSDARGIIHQKAEGGNGYVLSFNDPLKSPKSMV